MDNTTEITKADLEVINGKLDSIQAMMIELLEFKGEMESAIADFQPSNMMKMVSGLLGGGNKPPTLPRLDK